MSKQILASELAEIVTTLLVKPNLLGELDEEQKHLAFFIDIAQVVSDHFTAMCGCRSTPMAGSRIKKIFVDATIKWLYQQSWYSCRGSIC